MWIAQVTPTGTVTLRVLWQRGGFVSEPSLGLPWTCNVCYRGAHTLTITYRRSTQTRVQSQSRAISSSNISSKKLKYAFYKMKFKSSFQGALEHPLIEVPWPLWQLIWSGGLFPELQSPKHSPHHSFALQCTVAPMQSLSDVQILVFWLKNDFFFLSVKKYWSVGIDCHIAQLNYFF